MELTIEVIGIIAGLLTSSSLYPQVIKVYRMKSAEELSLPFLLTFLTGILIWNVYGFMINSFAIVFANIISTIGVSMLITLKIIYGKKKV